VIKSHYPRGDRALASLFERNIFPSFLEVMSRSASARGNIESYCPKSLRDGIGYVGGEPVVLSVLIVAAIFNIFGRSDVTMLPVFERDVLNLGASRFGYIAAAPMLGTVIRSL
jgi:hypothetical protein